MLNGSLCFLPCLQHLAYVNIRFRQTVSVTQSLIVITKMLRGAKTGCLFAPANADYVTDIVSRRNILLWPSLLLRHSEPFVEDNNFLSKQ